MKPKHLATILLCLTALIGCCQVRSTVYTGGLVISENADGTFDTISTTEVAPKEYIALLSQSSTSAPTEVVLKNTLGVTPSWSYTTTGTYTLTATSLSPTFVADRTVCSAELQLRGSNPRTYSCGRNTDSTVILYSMNSSLSTSDPGTTNQILIKIQVYY